MPEVEIMGMTVTPRTKRDQIMFLLLSAHMNGFDAASLEKWQPAMNQTIHFFADRKVYRACWRQPMEANRTGFVRAAIAI